MIPRRFDPIRSFMTPKSVLAKIGPNPRIISDDVWAKLVWAGLNLTAEDLPKRRQGPENSYPVEMCKALFLTWLFAGLRNTGGDHVDEIHKTQRNGTERELFAFL